MKQFILFCFFIWIISLPVFAQRGGDSAQQSAAIKTPLSFFAGYFDTGMVPTGSLTFDLPFMGVDYGVSENFTIGTNTLSSALAVFTLSPYLYLKARYRFFSAPTVSSVITGYGGYFNFPSQNNNPQFTAWFLNFTNNTSFFINKNNILNFHLTALKFNAQNGDPTDTKYLKLNLTTLALGLGYQTFFTENFGIEGQFLYSPYFSFSHEDAGQSTTLNLNTTDTSFPYFARILINYKTGKDSNLNFGYWSLSSLISGPWLGWQVLF